MMYMCTIRLVLFSESRYWMSAGLRSAICRDQVAHATHSYELCTISLTGNEVHVPQPRCEVHNPNMHLHVFSLHTYDPLSVWGWTRGRRERQRSAVHLWELCLVTGHNPLNIVLGSNRKLQGRVHSHQQARFEHQSYRSNPATLPRFTTVRTPRLGTMRKLSACMDAQDELVQSTHSPY